MKSRVLREALYWQGYLEKKSNAQLEDFTANAGSNNYTIFAVWYRDWWGDNFQAQPWCAMWVSCVFRRAMGKDVQGAIMPHFAYCLTGVNQFKKLGMWHTSNPQIGDVIMFKDSGGTACHVGIVYNVDKSRVYTIEGNTSGGNTVIANGGGVCKKSYPLTYNRILGYGRPDYAKGDSYVEELKKLQNQAELIGTALDSLTSEVKALKKQLADTVLPKYGYIDENMPEWAKPTIQKLCNMGFLKGDENGNLQLSYNDLRGYVALDRAGVFDV